MGCVRLIDLRGGGIFAYLGKMKASYFLRDMNGAINIQMLRSKFPKAAMRSLYRS